MKFGTITGIDT